MPSQYDLHEMDCRIAMSLLMEPDSVDAIVTDPPYGLGQEADAAEVIRHWLAGEDYAAKGNGFMNAKWDSFVPGPSVWREAYRVLKPGGYLIAFFGTRTYDLGTLAIRLAGFEIRDQLAWVFGSGFPKSLDVSKAIDKAAGAEREILSERANRSSFDPDAQGGGGFQRGTIVTDAGPATAAAKQWQGWGTALKPAYEPIVLARKPFDCKTVAANVLTHGTGALNVDGCRVAGESTERSANRVGVIHGLNHRPSHDLPDTPRINGSPLGRWPANLCHDGSDEVLAGFPTTTSGKMRAGTIRAAQDEPGSVVYGTYGGNATDTDTIGDSGSAARFFYCAKASKTDRGDGNVHPTVKPTDLMRWLCRLVTPPGGTVLDPFAGSGSTGKAALLEGFNFVGCEMTPEYAAIAHARLAYAAASLPE